MSINEEPKKTAGISIHSLILISFLAKQAHNGPLRIEERFPELIPYIESILLRNGAQAQCRRRTDVITSFGTHLPSLVYLAHRDIPGLREKYPNLAPNTIGYLMMPPRKNAKSASKYKCLIKARPFRIENDKHNITATSHRCFSTVNAIEELFMCFPSEGRVLDCDNMAKINMNGKTAVSRYHQADSFFLEKDVPKLDPHDFPVSNYTATVSGYFEVRHDKEYKRQLSREISGLFQRKMTITKDLLERELGSTQPEVIHYDNRGRMHVDICTTGVLNLFCRANIFHVASIETHVNDLCSIYSGGFPASLAIRADRGPDWGVQNFLNVFMLGRLFIDSKMDVFCLFHFAADNSAFGIIERKWAPTSKWLAGVSYSPVLEGESVPPAKQSSLSPDQLREKEIKLFDRNLQLLNNDLSHGASHFAIPGTSVISKAVPCRKV